MVEAVVLVAVVVTQAQVEQELHHQFKVMMALAIQLHKEQGAVEVEVERKALLQHQAVLAVMAVTELQQVLVELQLLMQAAAAVDRKVELLEQVAQVAAAQEASMIQQQLQEAQIQVAVEVEVDLLVQGVMVELAAQELLFLNIL
jgi:hypothetical protein